MEKLRLIDITDEEFEEMKSFDYDDEITKNSGEENELSNKEK